MRICLVSREYPTDDHVGGIGTYTEKTARVLVALGHAVDVITEGRDETETTTVEDGVVVHRLAPTRSRALRAVIRSRAVAGAIGRLPVQPDIVQACEFRAEAFWYSFQRPARTKLVTRLATPSFLVRRLNEGTDRRVSVRHAYIDLPERIQTVRSDGIIAITRAIGSVVSDAWHIPGHRIKVVRTGVDFARRYSASGVQLPDELRGRQYILFFGRLEERKGVHVLAQALPEVLASNPGLHVVFAGNSVDYKGEPMRAFVERCNAASLDRLHFFPRLPQRELHPVLKHSMFAVLPSLWEAMGNVSLEALDMGRPVVATLHSGLEEIVEHGRSGLLVEPGDVQGLRDAIARLVVDDELLRRLSAGAAARAMEFDLTTAGRELVDFYRSVMVRDTGEPSLTGQAGPAHARR